MRIEDLLKLTPENLAKQQHDALRLHAINRLEELIMHLKHGDYAKAKEMTFDSPAGDGNGLDNACLSFGEDDDGDIDIGFVLDRLIHLYRIIQSQPK